MNNIEIYLGKKGLPRPHENVSITQSYYARWRGDVIQASAALAFISVQWKYPNDLHLCYCSRTFR